MSNIFGIVPSRRLGRSLGITTIPMSTCTYSCVYCQRGRTKNMTDKREEYYPLKDLIQQLMAYKDKTDKFDVITLVGEGEPTLYSKTGALIEAIKQLFDKKVALITNGSLLFDEDVQKECAMADIVMPTLDAWDEDSFTQINRPIKTIAFEQMYQGLLEFRQHYKGEFYLELMCVGGISEKENSSVLLTQKINQLSPDQVYINTPVRPPAEDWVKRCPEEFVNRLKKEFKSTKDVEIPDTDLYSENKDMYQAIIEIIKRHPLDKKNIVKFCQQRNADSKQILERLKNDDNVEKIDYENNTFYRVKTIRREIKR